MGYESFWICQKKRPRERCSSRRSHLMVLLAIVSVALACLQIYTSLQAQDLKYSGNAKKLSSTRSTLSDGPKESHTVNNSSALSKGDASKHDQRTNDQHVTQRPSKSRGPVPQSECAGNVELLMGHKRPYKGFLTIAMLSVPRQGASYLKETIASLFGATSDSDREEVTIVVSLADKNESWSRQMQIMIDESFRANLDRGEIQVVQPEMSVYPNFSEIHKRTYNDTIQQVRWRTKHNVDLAYLFGYSETLSEYYLQLEDDVIASENFVAYLRQFVASLEQVTDEWFMLHFGFGFFGQLFRSRDLCLMKSSFLLFREEKPCDLLIEDLKRIMRHKAAEIKKEKKLFKHIGKYSSLKGITRSMKHLNVTNAPPAKKLYVSRFSRNPDALITTSLEAFSYYTPEKALSVNDREYFWAYTPTSGDFYRIVLNSTVKVTRVLVRTGLPATGKDVMEHALVYSDRELSQGKCMNKHALGKIAPSGYFEHVFNEPMELKCLEIIFIQTLHHWVAISRIQIET